jgi:queuosine precursor transporter
MIALFYIAAVVSANVLTAAIAPMIIGPLIIPAGSVSIGLTFLLRDMVQLRYGRKMTYGFIVLALILSALTSYVMGDTLYIVLASSVTFMLSETVDTEIFTQIKKSLRMRVVLSGAIGGLLDSVVFVIIGLSPLGVGFIAWNAVPLAIVGQMSVKLTIQFLVLPFLSR